MILWNYAFYNTVKSSDKNRFLLDADKNNYRNIRILFILYVYITVSSLLLCYR